MTTASRSSNGNGNGHSAEALATVRRLKSGAPAHDFTAEDRRRGAQRTNELKRERAASRAANAEPLDLAEKLYLLESDKQLLLQTFNRLSYELACGDCRHALTAAELVLKYLVGRPRQGHERGLGGAALTLTARIRELGLDAKAEELAVDLLRPGERHGDG